MLQITGTGKVHPFQTMLYMGMAASGFLFLMMIALYTAQRFGEANAVLDIKIPKFFILSTFILLFSSFCMSKARQHFYKDNLRTSAKFLGLTFVLGMIFAVLQGLGWVEFYRMGFGVPTSNVASSYVYVISGIHFMHLLGGLLFLLVVFFQAYKKSSNIVDELIMVTNPYEKQKFRMLVTYWHYVDFLWLALFFYFIITF